MLKSYGSDDNIHTLSCMSVCSGDKTGDCHGGKREERFDTCGGINGERERERDECGSISQPNRSGCCCVWGEKLKMCKRMVGRMENGKMWRHWLSV